MQFFDLAPMGFTLCVISFVFIALCLPFLQSSAPTASISGSQQRGKEEHFADVESTKNFYEVIFSVKQGGGFVGMTCADVCMQLSRLPGVKKVSLSVSRTFASHIDDMLLTAEDRLQCEVEDTGVVSLRQVKDLSIENENDLQKLGMQREQRHLYEVALKADSSLVAASLDSGAMRHVLGACPIAVRGKGSIYVCERPGEGDVVLLEADERYVGSAPWLSEFSVTHKVPDSSPLRVGGVHDRARCVLVCLGFVVYIGLVTLDVIHLAAGGGIFVMMLVLTNAHSMHTMYKAIKAPVLLTIAGAYGLSAALQVTGIALFASGKMKDLAMPLGPQGIRLAVYFISVFLSMFMNNSATIAIIGPMLVTMLLDSQMESEDDQTAALKALTWVMVFAAGTCLTTPLGYQTNLMVMKDGGYSFGDFTKYGIPIQVLHMVATLALVYVFVDLL